VIPPRDWPRNHNRQPIERHQVSHRHDALFDRTLELSVLHEPRHGCHIARAPQQTLRAVAAARSTYRDVYPGVLRHVVFRKSRHDRLDGRGSIHHHLVLTLGSRFFRLLGLRNQRDAQKEAASK
jgi:hypothetical protein